MISDGFRGTCFGFAVRSSLPFHYLRTGVGEDLVVSAPSEVGEGERGQMLQEWILTRDGHFHARLYRDGNLFRLWIAPSAWFVVDPRVPSISVPEDPDVVKREERLWGIPALLCFLARGRLPLHAAAVEVDGEAVLLAAPGGVGKTTMAAGFVRAGYRLLSEDLACIALLPTPAVIPGPAVIRLRRDVATRLELNVGERLEAGDDRLHIALARDRRGNCEPVPVRALVFLRPTADDGVGRASAQIADAIRDLFALSFRLPDERDLACSFSAVSDLAEGVPTWNFSYTLGLDRLDDAVERIVSDVRGD